MLKRTLLLFECYAITHHLFENLKNFWTSSPAFSFCMSPTNIVDGAVFKDESYFRAIFAYTSTMRVT